MKARSKTAIEHNQVLRTGCSIAIAATIFLGGCATQRAKFSQEFSRQMQLQQQVQQMNQQDPQQTERANAELGKLIRPVPKTEIIPLEMSNGLPKKDPEPPLPAFKEASIPTGRIRVAADGTTYHEMRSVNGATYWTDKTQ